MDYREKYSEELVLKAKSLYLEFTPKKAISKVTGIDTTTLNRYIYGTGSIMEVDEQSWYYLRHIMTKESVLENRQRNYITANMIETMTIDEQFEQIKMLREKKDKHGKKAVIKPLDLKTLSDMMVQNKKIVMVDELETTLFDESIKQLDQKYGTQEIENKAEVIDMQLVADALSQDAGMQKLLETRGFRYERRNAETGASANATAAKADAVREDRQSERRGHSRDVTSNDGEFESVIQSDKNRNEVDQPNESDASSHSETTIRDRGEDSSSRSIQGEIAVNRQGDSRESSVESEICTSPVRAASERQSDDKADNQVSDRESRHAGAAARSDSEFSNFGDGAQIDPFEDEYS